MITSVVQRRRPRWPVVLLIGGAVAAAGLFAAVAFAALASDTGTGSPGFTGDCDVTVASNIHSADCQLGPAGAIVSYIGSNDTLRQASGTGLFDPFVRLQGGPTEQGYNTCSQSSCGGDVSQFDTKTGSWTHAIKVNAIPLVDCDGSGPGTATCWEIFNDINESNTAKRISLNVVQIFFTNSAVLTGYSAGTPPTFSTPASAVTTEEYDFQGNILINDVNSGSGRGDLRYLVPTTGHTWNADTWFVLYSKWGTTTGTPGANGTGTYVSDGGFEEWKVRKSPNVSITKTADASSVNAGSDIGFTITVTNTGVADATGVTISDNLPGGTGPSPVHWTESPDNTNCTISGSDGSQVLSCGPVTLAAGGGSLSVHVSATTTGDNCGVYDNTATFTSTNAGSGSASDSITVNCAAVQILKESTKTGNPLVLVAGAVFHVTGSGGYATDVTDNGTGDEDSTIGSVCISGLAPGEYTVTETTPPAGYGSGTAVDGTATAASGTNCGTSKPSTAQSAVFTDPPLAEIGVTFTDLGSGETSSSIVCTQGGAAVDPVSENGNADPAFDDTNETYTNLPPGTYVCTVVVDP